MCMVFSTFAVSKTEHMCDDMASMAKVVKSYRHSGLVGGVCCTHASKVGWNWRLARQKCPRFAGISVSPLDVWAASRQRYRMLE